MKPTEARLFIVVLVQYGAYVSFANDEGVKISMFGASLSRLISVIYDFYESPLEQSSRVSRLRTKQRLFILSLYYGLCFSGPFLIRKDVKLGFIVHQIGFLSLLLNENLHKSNLYRKRNLWLEEGRSEALRDISIGNSNMKSFLDIMLTILGGGISICILYVPLLVIVFICTYMYWMLFQPFDFSKREHILEIIEQLQREKEKPDVALKVLLMATVSVGLSHILTIQSYCDSPTSRKVHLFFLALCTWRALDFCFLQDTQKSLNKFLVAEVYQRFP